MREEQPKCLFSVLKKNETLKFQFQKKIFSSVKYWACQIYVEIVEMSIMKIISRKK